MPTERIKGETTIQYRDRLGLCIYCGGARDSERKICAACSKRRAELRRLNRDGYRRQHRCLMCGVRLPDGWPRVSCAKCEQRNAVESRRRREIRQAAGLCIRCGKRPPREARTTCAECSERQYLCEKRHRWKAVTG